MSRRRRAPPSARRRPHPGTQRCLEAPPRRRRRAVNSRRRPAACGPPTTPAAAAPWRLDTLRPPLLPPLSVCRSQAPRRVGGSAGGGWNDGQAASQMRRQESQLLNAWTNGVGMQLAAAGTMVLVIALLVSAGGPPADARCTLPWC